jgi:predicted dehydrogenase
MKTNSFDFPKLNIRDTPQVTLNAGLIGFGFIGEVHARAIRAANGNIISIAAQTIQEAQLAASKFTDAKGVTIDEMINDSSIDVIHICTPNIFHAEIAERAINAGKHVICEKPLGVSVEEAENLTKIASEKKVIATIPFIYRYYPSVREARDRVLKLKEPLNLLHGHYLQDWLSRETTVNWRIDPQLGGPSRAFADIGVHWCDLLEYVTDHRITRINAQLLKIFNSRGDYSDVQTEDGVTLIFTTDKGAHGSLVISQVSAGRKNKLWFSFDSPTESFEFNQESPDLLWIGGLESNQIVMRGVTEQSDGANAVSFLPAGHPQGYQDCFNQMVRDTYGAITGSKPQGLPTFEDGFRAAKLTEAVLLSARLEEWVDVK